MVRLDLSSREITQLEEIFQTTTDRRFRNRVQAILMTHRGRTQPQIAADLLVDERTVRRWLTAWRDKRLEGLRIHWAPGAPARIRGPLVAEVIEWVRLGPQACGLNRANWTRAELAQHLWRTHGVRVAERSMRRFCRRHGIRPYRPTYRFLRADTAQQAQARRDLRRLKKRGVQRRMRPAQPG
ncbi:helix-turn-helix domain-containing protein [Chondromyces crocatus]|uniref:Uncharacterized protein n=1 Tax=Chondromyces crocatus TaxID=52 RepID=A0A0K1EDR9_CHOCO|nr:uncharacterized protein CMC5_028590 [Chondromyces crocatus]